MTLTDRIIEACRLPSGRTLSQICEAIGDATDSPRKLISRLVKRGRLHTLGSNPYVRYFTSGEDAKAYEPQHALDMVEIRKQQRETHLACQRRADSKRRQRALTRKRNTERAAIVEFCRNEAGRSISEISEMLGKRAYSAVGKLVIMGTLHSAGPRYWQRYFTDPEAAKAYLPSLLADVASTKQATKYRNNAPRPGRARSASRVRPGVARPPVKVKVVDTREVITPDHIEVQVCRPTRAGERYVPEPGFHRAITADWSTKWS